MRKRLLVVALVAGCLLPTGAAAQTLQRLEGADRYGTAAEISRQTFPTPTETVFLATGEAFPDALSAAPAAGPTSPVLLTTRDSLPPSTVGEIDRLRPGRVVIIGGEMAVSEAVARDAASLTGATVDRISGGDRYGTAAAVAEQFFQPGLPLVYVASGERFPDAVAAGAAGARSGAPVLLVQQNAVPRATTDALAALGPQRVVVVGGELVISEAVRQQLGAERIAGADRYATAVALAVSTSGADEPVAVLASGESFADAVAGGPAAARRDAPLLLVRSACMPQPTADRLAAWGPTRGSCLAGRRPSRTRLPVERAAQRPRHSTSTPSPPVCPSRGTSRSRPTAPC